MKNLLLVLVLSMTFIGCSKDGCGCERTTYKNNVVSSVNPVDCTKEVPITALSDTISYKIECFNL